jgi:hypothetical protein
MSDITYGKVTLKKRLNQAGATPLFGGQSAQKFVGSLPPLAAGIRSSCFGRAAVGNQELCKTARQTKP